MCPSHGGKAPQVRQAAAVRVALAETLATAERHDPAEVLAAAIHSADVLHRDAVRLLAAAEMTPDQVIGLVERVELAARLAKLGLDHKIDERRTAVAEREGAVIAGILQRVLDALDLDDRQRRLVATVVPRELRAVAARPVLEIAP